MRPQDMRQSLVISSLSEIDSASREFISRIGDRRIVAFHAPMGAGKTTFTTAICRTLGVEEDAVSSPTFSIVNEYRGADGESIFHFDFYRLERISEVLDIGFYDYIDSGCLCLIEWPEIVEEILPEETLHVWIEVRDDSSREIVWED